MTKLSPAAQAVWCAYEQILENECVLTETDVKALAAALRAAADIVDDREASRQLDAIAYELEAQ